MQGEIDKFIIIVKDFNNPLSIIDRKSRQKLVRMFKAYTAANLIYFTVQHNRTNIPSMGTQNMYQLKPY